MPAKRQRAFQEPSEIVGSAGLTASVTLTVRWPRVSARARSITTTTRRQCLTYTHAPPDLKPGKLVASASAMPCSTNQEAYHIHRHTHTHTCSLAHTVKGSLAGSHTAGRLLSQSWRGPSSSCTMICWSTAHTVHGPGDTRVSLVCFFRYDGIWLVRSAGACSVDQIVRRDPEHVRALVISGPDLARLRRETG